MNIVRADLFLPVDQELLDSTEDEVFATHEEIVAAIRDGDAELAAAAAAAHVERVRAARRPRARGSSGIAAPV